MKTIIINVEGVLCRVEIDARGEEGYNLTIEPTVYSQSLALDMNESGRGQEYERTFTSEQCLQTDNSYYVVEE